MTSLDAQPRVGHLCMSFADYLMHVADISYPVYKLESELEGGLQHSVLHGPTQLFCWVCTMDRALLSHIHDLLSFPPSPSD